MTSERGHGKPWSLSVATSRSPTHPKTETENTMNSRHHHRKKTSAIRPFSSPISGARENPSAHGNVCVVDTCNCGAVRQTNVNQQHRERGPWVEPEATR